MGALPSSPAKNQNGSNGANGGSAGGSELLSNLNKVGGNLAALNRVGTGVTVGLNSYLQNLGATTGLKEAAPADTLAVSGVGSRGGGAGGAGDGGGGGRGQELVFSQKGGGGAGLNAPANCPNCQRDMRVCKGLCVLCLPRSRTYCLVAPVYSL